MPPVIRELIQDAWWGLSRALIVVGVLVMIAVAVAGWNLLHYSDPPAACQVLGGSWTPWSVWRCG